MLKSPARYQPLNQNQSSFRDQLKRGYFTANKKESTLTVYGPGVGSSGATWALWAMGDAIWEYFKNDVKTAAGFSNPFYLFFALGTSAGVGIFMFALANADRKDKFMHNRAKEFITDVEHTLIDAAKLMKPKESDADTTINTPNSSTQFNTIQSLLSKIHRMKVGKADSIEVAERLYRLISQTVEPQSFVDFHDSLKNIDGVNHFAYSIEDKVAAVFEGINIDPDAVMKFV